MPTRKYLVIQRCAPRAHAPPSPEQMHQMYAAFNAWQERFGDSVVDMGGKLKPAGKVLTATGVTDGPFTEAKEIVGGYMVVAAESYERAVEIVSECPGLLAPGSSTEIREISSP
jgi:hypothetical protein